MKTRNVLAGVQMTSASIFRVLLFFAYFLYVVAIFGNRTIQFEDHMKIYTVLQGDRVSLSCSPNIIDEILIVDTGSQLVISRTLKESFSDEFDFVCNETSCTLSIKQVEKKHADTYTCHSPQMSLKIEVLSSPSQDYPVCNSSYTSTTFFLDSFQEPFNFSCLSEEGNPPVNMSVSVNHGDDEINNKTDENLTISKTNETVSLSYSSYLDSSFNNSILVCNVTQQLPAPYQSYNKSCSFGPLMLLPTFSVWIHPSHFTVTTNSTENITLMCTSNVSGVELEWTNIPLNDLNYIITRINDSLQLEIFDYGSSIDLPITIQCSGSYGGRTVSQYATIDSASTDEHKLLFTSIIAALVVFVIMVIIAIVLVLIGVLKNRKRENQQPPAISLTDTGQTRSPNDNNANNVNVGPDDVTDTRHSSLNEATSNMIQDDTEMVDNPIYGSNRKQHLDFGRMEENQEEGNYATVSV